jgi:hypothetical protein
LVYEKIVLWQQLEFSLKIACFKQATPQQKSVLCSIQLPGNR